MAELEEVENPPPNPPANDPPDPLNGPPSPPPSRPPSAHDSDTWSVPTSVRAIQTQHYSSACKLKEVYHLTDNNWYDWKERMIRIFFHCKIMGYIDGSIACPNVHADPEGADNWTSNDFWAQQIIMNNVTDSQLTHIKSKYTAKGMYTVLSDTHENKAHLSVTYLHTSLYQLRAKEDDDLLKHLDDLKVLRDRANKFPNRRFHIEDDKFKTVVIASLPPSWATYVEPYACNIYDEYDTDTKRNLPADSLIGLLREEYRLRKIRNGNGNGAITNMVTHNGGSSNSLKARIGKKNLKANVYCEHCKKTGHWTSKCRKLESNKCFNCGKHGHRAKECWAPKKDKEKDKDKGKGKPTSSKKDKEETMVIDEVAFVSDEEHYNFDTYQVCNGTDNDERLIYYDWLADNATTSHVCCDLNSFSDYTSLGNSSVTGVGGKEATIAGRGTVELLSTCKGKQFLLRLENVLHVPGQKNNLISLGRWDSSGGRYIGGKGQLTLITKDGKEVAQGTKLDRHLYKMNVTVNLNRLKLSSENQTFQTRSKPPSWETWHRRFGHVGYSGLEKLLKYDMVNGFNVDESSPKPDCIACTEAKQHVQPFPKTTDRKTEKGDLTHIDVWGKYGVRSINGNQYYLLLVDDHTRFTSVDCMKEKSDAVQGVKNYLTRLITQGYKPKAIHFDEGGEFLNQALITWCKERGIEIRTTAPYSAPQNGLVERMNRTLEELSRAMLRARGLPEFLWEYAILNAVYVRNRSFTTPLGTITPYQGFNGHKPNVSNLREFGAPVWVLLQGQKRDRKMLPRSKQQLYMGYEDGSKAVKYYNPETRKILVSRNYKYLDPQIEEPPEEITITPTATPTQHHEGESEGSDGKNMVPMGENEVTRESDVETRKPQKRKRATDFLDDVDVNEPRKTRGIRRDYKRLENPELGEETNEMPDLTEIDEANLVDDEPEHVYAVIAGDELTSLSEARQSPEWETWKTAMDDELKLLREMGTWELVQKPPEAIAIPNKWTFVRKRNKEGTVTRHRARLVAKGCT